MLRFFFQDDPVRQAGKSIAKGSLLLGLFLIGFGMLVFILRDIFAILAAAVFFIAGFSAIGYAIRIFWAVRRTRNSQDAYRDNVQVRIEDPFE